MLDINFIRENQSAVERAVREKRYKISIKDLLSVDDSRRELLKNVESLRQKRTKLPPK